MSGYGSIYGDYYGGPRRHRQKPSKVDKGSEKGTSTPPSGSPQQHAPPVSLDTTNPTKLTTGEANGGNHPSGPG
ncbi:hypothetical protein Dsin_023918 [Dipteronia sinensis]|uniref:Uncharacterized protein n=1 Tax=Dipteronia sinensis TaxID=43782 RepID=A0AAE0A488_9ROSI|nr:hypothetical protein Dsin_023918 [Dipteronia sinensis]